MDSSTTDQPTDSSSTKHASCHTTSQHSLEVRISRVVGEGLHEDVDITNFSQQSTRFTLDIDLSADFADLIEAISERQQQGTLKDAWREMAGPAWELEFTYLAERPYEQQNEAGVARLERGVIVRVEKAASPPERTARHSVRLRAVAARPVARVSACARTV